MTLPPGTNIPNGYCLKLLMSLYGPKQAPGTGTRILSTISNWWASNNVFLTTAYLKFICEDWGHWDLSYLSVCRRHPHCWHWPKQDRTNQGRVHQAIRNKISWRVELLLGHTSYKNWRITSNSIITIHSGHLGELRLSVAMSREQDLHHSDGERDLKFISNSESLNLMQCLISMRTT